jgi:amidase
MVDSIPSPSPLASPAIFAHDEFSTLDAVEQARLVRTGAVSAEELLDAALRRIEMVNPVLNAVVNVDPRRARAPLGTRSIDSPLACVPTLIKDLLPYPGLPIAFGSKALGAQVSGQGSDYTDALDRAGLLVVGKTATSELGLLGTTETLAYGPTRNPWDPSRSTGGSSGGAVAAVASGMVPLAHASDGGGSIRGPAAFTGLFGFKPSRGATRSTGIPPNMPLAMMLSDHCVCRTVRDSAAWFNATRVNERSVRPVPIERHGGAPRSAPLRIALYSQTGLGQEPEADVKEVLVRVARLCEAAGHHVLPSDGPRFDASRAADAFFLLSGLMVAGLIGQLKSIPGSTFDASLLEPYTRDLALFANNRPAEAAVVALAEIEACALSAERAFEDADVLLCPTTPFTAPKIGANTPESPFRQLLSFTESLAGYTAIASVAGWCAMSMPLFRSAITGMPVGAHFAAPSGADDRLFALAFNLEEMSPWL